MTSFLWRVFIHPICPIQLFGNCFDLCSFFQCVSRVMYVHRLYFVKILLLHMRSSIYWKPSWTFQFMITLDKQEGKQCQAMPPHLWCLAFLHSESTYDYFLLLRYDTVGNSYPLHNYVITGTSTSSS